MVADCLTSYRREFEKTFISAYESLPVLWDRSHANYGNYPERLEALRQLLPLYRKIKPTAGLSSVKRKINILRSNYRRELRKVVMSGNEKPTSWKFKSLRFLDKGEGDYQQPPQALKEEPRDQTKHPTDEALLQIASTIMNKPTDEFQIFGEFVASELRNLKSPDIQRKLKLVIQRAIIEHSELDITGAQ